MSLYVNKVSLEFNGTVFEDFDSFSDNSVTYHKAVNLMNKTGHAVMTPRYGFSVGVKTPAVMTLDLDKIAGGTCTVEFDNGKRITYGGVYTLESGEGAIDGETELTRTKTFSAETKVEE